MTLIIWNEVTIWWNEVTLSWEEVTWNEVTVNRTDEHIFRFFQIAIQNSFPFILVDVSMHFLVLPSSEISVFFLTKFQSVGSLITWFLYTDLLCFFTKNKHGRYKNNKYYYELL